MWVSGKRQLGLCFNGVAQAQHGKLGAVLYKFTAGGARSVPVREKHNMKAFLCRQAADPNFNFGNQADAALGTQDHLTNVRAST